jgi:hypothetical protein
MVIFVCIVQKDIQTLSQIVIYNNLFPSMSQKQHEYIQLHCYHKNDNILSRPKDEILSYPLLRQGFR